MERSSHGQHYIEFAVPAGSGSYAPGVLYFSATPTVAPRGVGALDLVSELQLLIGTLVATAVVEVDILKPGGDPALSADWLLAYSFTAAGLTAVSPLSGARARVRAKSGGTAGTQPVSAFWW